MQPREESFDQSKVQMNVAMAWKEQCEEFNSWYFNFFLSHFQSSSKSGIKQSIKTHLHIALKIFKHVQHSTKRVIQARMLATTKCFSFVYQMSLLTSSLLQYLA